MTTTVVVCLAIIVCVLMSQLIITNKALRIVSGNQQRLYVCFRALLKQICPEGERNILKALRQELEDNKSS